VKASAYSLLSFSSGATNPSGGRVLLLGTCVLHLAAKSVRSATLLSAEARRTHRGAKLLLAATA